MLPPPIQFIRHDMSMPLMELDVLLTKFNNTSGQQGLKSILKVSTSHHRYKRRSGLIIHNLLTNRPTHLFTTKTPHLQTFFPVRNSAIAARGTLIYQCTIQFQLVLKLVLIEKSTQSIFPPDVISNQIAVGARAQTHTKICSYRSTFVSFIGINIIVIISVAQFILKIKMTVGI